MQIWSNMEHYPVIIVNYQLYNMPDHFLATDRFRLLRPPSSYMFLSCTPSWMRLSASLCSLIPIVIFLEEDELFLLVLLDADDFLVPDRLREELRDLPVFLREELLDFLGDFLAPLRFLPPTRPLPERSMVSTFLARSFIAARASWNLFSVFIFSFCNTIKYFIF